MPGPNSAPNGDARLVRGYPAEEFVCVAKRDDKTHICGDTECKMISLRFATKRTGKTRR